MTQPTDDATPIRRLSVRQVNHLKLRAQLQNLPFDELWAELVKTTGLNQDTLPSSELKSFTVRWHGPDKESRHG